MESTRRSKIPISIRRIQSKPADNKARNTVKTIATANNATGCSTISISAGSGNSKSQKDLWRRRSIATLNKPTKTTEPEKTSEGIDAVDTESQFDGDKRLTTADFLDISSIWNSPQNQFVTRYICEHRPDFWVERGSSSFKPNDDPNLFHDLLESERKAFGQPAIKAITRSCMFNALMELNTKINGNPAIVQSAGWYFDSYLALQTNASFFDIKCIALACFWIAQKLHGPHLSAASLVHITNDVEITEEIIMTTELKILSALLYQTMAVIPQDFVRYWASMCGGDHFKIEVAATFICMAGLLISNQLSEELPSTIACAAIETAISLVSVRETKINLIALCDVYMEKQSSAIVLNVCCIMLKAIRTLASFEYPYKTLLYCYGSTTNAVGLEVIESLGTDI